MSLFSPSRLIFSVLLFLALVLGLFTGLDPATGAKLGAMLLLFMLFLAAWLLPDQRGGLRAMAVGFVVFGFIETAWPRLLVFKRPGIPAVNPEKIAFAALLIAWFVLLLTSSSVRASAKAALDRYRPVVYALALLATMRLFSVSMGIAEPAYYYFGIKAAITEVLAYSLMLVIAATLWKSARNVRPFIWAIVLGGVVVCVLALYESSVSRNLFGTVVDVDDDLSGRLGEAVREKFRGGKYRVQSTFEHPLVLAEFLVVLIPCLVYLLATSRRWLLRGFLLLSLALFLWTVHKTDSRAAIGLVMLNFVVGAMLFAYRQLRLKASIAGVLIGLLVPALMILLPVLLVLMMGLLDAGHSEAQSTSARLLMFERSLPLLLDSPLLGYGIGLGGAKVGYLMSNGLASIDSHFLSLPLDSGLIALLAYLFVMAWFGWQLFVRVGDKRHAEGALAICMLMALIGFCGMRAILSINTNHWVIFSLMGVIGTFTVKEALVRSPVAFLRGRRRAGVENE